VEIIKWAAEAAQVVNHILNLTPEVLQITIEKGLANSKRFDTQLALDRIELIYKNILQGNEQE
jgi:hypothetical protein